MSKESVRKLALTAMLLIAVAYVWQQNGGTITLPIVAPEKATAATYVYEKDQNAVPPAVGSALNEINRTLGIRATEFEKDTKNAAGQVPAQYVVPLTAATEAGLPALVVTAGDKVLKVVKDPKTTEAVMEAVQ